MIDSKKLERAAQVLVVEARRGFGSPPSFGANWQPLWGAKVDRIEINPGGTPSVATIWFPELRWEQSSDIIWGDNIRIRTNEQSVSARTIIFAGFVTSYLTGFSGGTDQTKTFERNAIVVSSYRWLFLTTCPLYGQLARGPDDYTNYGQENQQAKANSATFLSGQRAIFNADGRPNKDPVLLQNELCDTSIFADPDIAEYWTARDMLRYVLSPTFNLAYQYWPIADPNQLSGLSHADFDNTLNHIAVDGLSILEAVQLICKHLGWSFREDYDNDGVNLIFFKIGAASGYTRNAQRTTILHQLHAPAVAEIISDAVLEGKKLLWSMDLAEDIASVVNNPWGLGAPQRFEFTAELVPAWLDDDLEPDTSESYANLFFTESDLQNMVDKNSKSYFKYYHPRGDDFRRDVGRKWSLNESGRYSKADTYNRGVPFDFIDIVPDEYIIDSDTGKRLFAPFRRQLLPCLTIEKNSLNSIGIVVEFSFDGGETWQIIPASISSLKDECGIYIDEANLAELVDKDEGIIAEGALEGIQLNYWTSFCDDKLNNRIFKDGEWKTRIRVTATVQLDQRIRRQAAPSSASGSPFQHSQIYDFSEKYGLLKRTPSSIFAPSSPPADTDLSAYELDSTDFFDKHLQAIRAANEDKSVSGQFTLERLWLGDGSGEPEFALGDCIESITGREYDLSASLGSATIYPEIIQIIYLPEQQKTKLITRDLRFAEVLL